jgi:hypothetical protein
MSEPGEHLPVPTNRASLALEEIEDVVDRLRMRLYEDQPEEWPEEWGEWSPIGVTDDARAEILEQLWEVTSVVDDGLLAEAHAAQQRSKLERN